MKKYRIEHHEVRYVNAIICDCCGKEFTDIMDTQEFVCIDKHGGYKSAIGDDIHYQLDLCTQCFAALLGGYVRRVE